MTHRSSPSGTTRTEIQYLYSRNPQASPAGIFSHRWTQMDTDEATPTIPKGLNHSAPLVQSIPKGSNHSAQRCRDAGAATLGARMQKSRSTLQELNPPNNHRWTQMNADRTADTWSGRMNRTQLKSRAAENEGTRGFCAGFAAFRFLWSMSIGVGELPQMGSGSLPNRASGRRVAEAKLEIMAS